MLDEKNIEKRINPFFESYNTPHNTVPFHRIKLEDYEEAFMEGIRRDDESTDKLINDPAEPTFENTIARVDTEKGEHYYDLLSRVSNVFSCLVRIGLSFCAKASISSQVSALIMQEKTLETRLRR